MPRLKLSDTRGEHAPSSTRASQKQSFETESLFRVNSSVRYNPRDISLKIEKGWKPGRVGGVSRLSQLGDSGVYDEFSIPLVSSFFGLSTYWRFLLRCVFTPPQKKSKFIKNKTESNRKRTNRVQFDLSAYSTFLLFQSSFLIIHG